jgi:hypothetical protein
LAGSGVAAAPPLLPPPQAVTNDKATASQRTLFPILKLSAA